MGGDRRTVLRGGLTDGPKSMMSVTIKTGAPPTVGTPSKLFNIRADIVIFPRGLSFDVSRDGKRFVMIRSRRRAVRRRPCGGSWCRTG